jgi:hypothetical protein
MRRRRVLLLLTVLHGSVRARIELSHVAILPAHDVGRRAVVTQHLEDLAVALGFAYVMPPDYQAVTRICSEY